MYGIVKWYNIKKGYGFIQGEDGQDIFIHKSQVPFWSIFLNAGDKVQFKKEITKKGIMAINVKAI